MQEALYLSQIGSNLVQAHLEDIEEFNDRHEQIARFLENAAAANVDHDQTHKQRIQAATSSVTRGNPGPASA